MSVQDRAQAQLSQLDKEVSPPLGSAGWHVAKIQHRRLAFTTSYGTTNLKCCVLTMSCSSCPNTPPSTTLRSRPPSPRPTWCSVLPAYTSSSSSLTLLESFLSTLPGSSSLATTPSMLSSLQARPTILSGLQYVPRHNIRNRLPPQYT
jgi:hypothetical protein